MAEDRKFYWDEGLQCFRNRVNGAAIPHDEPVIIFRARDIHALNTLWFYLSQIEDDHHKQAVRERIAEFSAFRASEEARMKEPGITHDIRLNSEVHVNPNGQLTQMVIDAHAELIDYRPICSADGCNRREDCGPFCRNRN